jgi:hypothetical protein
MGMLEKIRRFFPDQPVGLSLIGLMNAHKSVLQNIMYVIRRDFHKILVSPSSLAQKKRRHATRLRILV